MKKLYRSPVFWIGTILCIIVIVLYFCGFRITYAPELENSWEAISACAGWFGALMSAIAILVAIRIPKNIAEQQNKITLFEKRYNSFNTFTFLLSVVKRIINDNPNEEFLKVYLHTMAETYTSVSTPNVLSSDYNDVSDIYISLILETGKIKYLFDLDESEIEILISFLFQLDCFVSDVFKGNTINLTDLTAMYTVLNCKGIEEKLEAQLNISSNI